MRQDYFGEPEAKKSKDLTRTNLWIRNELMQYCRRMAAVKDMSLTDFINDLFQQDMERNKEIYDKLCEISDKVK